MQDGWIGQMRKGVAEFCVLSVLARGEAYGYEILTEISKHPSLSLKESTLYLMLARLEKEGFVRMRQVKSDKGPARRYFRLTETGETRLQDMGRFWADFAADVSVLTEKGAPDGGT
ncbi:MAG: PadR family transcriptional regulator [Pseudomonadota bacterium]